MTRSRTTALVAGLAALTLVLYAGIWAAFPDRLTDIAFYTWLDIAFIPVSVLLVTLVINRLLEQRERAALLHKLNMVVGAFFSEVGTDLVCLLAAFDGAVEKVRPNLLFTASWTPAEFSAAERALAGHETGIAIDAGDLDVLRDFLISHRSFLLRLLENQTLLEHTGFTDTLWAVFHLTEELAARGELSTMPAPDRHHVELDMERAYGRLLASWIGYVGHLKSDYPYLFSFALRTNPFDPDADIHVAE